MKIILMVNGTIFNMVISKLIHQQVKLMVGYSFLIIIMLLQFHIMFSNQRLRIMLILLWRKSLTSPTLVVWSVELTLVLDLGTW